MQIKSSDTTVIRRERLPSGLWTMATVSVMLLILWQFPAWWYTSTDHQMGSFWLTEQNSLPGWSFSEIPVSKSAEAMLVADRLVNGEFAAPDGRVVRVFSAKRYVEASNEVGLFAHTPDRCWTEAGWRLEATQPDYEKLVVHGISLVFERRIFSNGVRRELVYFTGLVGGQPLPYRLDHNLSVGMKVALRAAKDETGTTLRAADTRFWRRVWDAFVARRPLVGPKQFLRISVPVSERGVAVADALLQEGTVRLAAASILQKGASGMARGVNSKPFVMLKKNHENVRCLHLGRLSYLRDTAEVTPR